MRERQIGAGGLEFQTTPFRGGIALQTSITPPDQPILSRELYPVAEGDMIQRNTSPQTTGTTAHHVRQVRVLCTKCAEPGEVIPPPDLGVEALNQDALPPPRCLHHLAHHHLPIPLWWGVAHLPPIKEVLPQSDKRQGIYHQSSLQIPLSGKPDLKRFQISIRDSSWRSAAEL